jgi:hypothetical protein
MGPAQQEPASTPAKTQQEMELKNSFIMKSPDRSRLETESDSATAVPRLTTEE